MKALISFQISGSGYPVTQRHIPEERSPENPLYAWM